MAVTRWNALIRTHHITSRKKVARLRHAAMQHDVFALLRSGGAPGMMYVEGAREGVEGWVGCVQRLRYKDYQLASRPAEIKPDDGRPAPGQIKNTDPATGLHETPSVKDFGVEMQRRGIMQWWRKSMGYLGAEERF